MRFVDPADIYAACLPGLLSAAKSTLASLLEVDDSEQRKAFIDSKQPVWSRFKDAMADVGYEKCWYCESKEVRSDNAVDHFRPKNRVYESETHPGYWWLAFDHHNFRFSCMFCNSYRRSVSTAGGKRDHFPLVEEEKRAMRPSDLLANESPLLIDPCDAVDPSLLWFDDDGMPRLNHQTALLDEYAELKVEVSSKLYHLDHPRLTSARRRVFADISELCADGDHTLSNLDMADANVATAYRRLLKHIRQRTKPNSEYSATALCALQGLRVSSETAGLALKLP